ncbi:MAG: hypothetical protein LBQ54_11955 [Planctomycetaceae bacterium]|nr:hypothetical protein [Planctomycetaceae bacterium]
MSVNQKRQNSFFTAVSNVLRGMIVFTVLISLPIFAIFWDKMPEGVQKGLNRFRYFVHNITEDTTSNDVSEVPLSVPSPVALPSADNTVMNRTVMNPSPALTTVLPQKKPQPLAAIQLVSNTQSQYANALQYGPETQSSQSAEVVQIEMELQRLGAKNCRLENWGNDGLFYRYSCFVSPSHGNERFRRYFQEIASSPAEAMKKVHERVTLWQQEWR